MNRVIELLREAADASDGSDEPEDAAYFRSAAEKLGRGEKLTDNEADLVRDEIASEQDKLNDARVHFPPLSTEDRAYFRELNKALKLIDG